VSSASVTTISARQCRAARGLLGWSQDQLAEAAKVARATIANFETGKSLPVTNNLAAIRSALEDAGVRFIPENGGGDGVRMKKRQS
jgi:transcriptional regulator with XRE-family HTH domain